ncbi:MAG: carboxylesterase family protein [Pseudomonadota bacterium]
MFAFAAAIRWNPMMSMRTLLALGLLATGLSASGTMAAQDVTAGPGVAVRTGALRGATHEGIYSFKGIPYGAPTGGESRFKPPRQPAPWQGTRDALRYGDQCPQMPPTGGNDKPDPTVKISEDCLVLNVWTPGLGDGKRRPVMVWLHGGGFVAGSGGAAATDGERLARRGDVVVVTLNHRLNAFGYLYLGGTAGAEFADSGNVGQLDLLLALQWVRDNIAQFGGNPAEVTLFGESGGGSKVGTLMGTPAARGLFQRAILQSGFAITGILPQDATKITDGVLKELGLSRQQVRELQRVPVDKLIDALRTVLGGLPYGLGPVIDGRSVPRHPFTPDAPAQSADIPVMAGYNKDETTVLFPPADAFTLDWASLRAHMVTTLPGADVDAFIATLRSQRPAATPSELYFAVTTEQGMGTNARTLATRKSAQQAPVYLYRLEWESPLNGGKLRAHHGLDVALVFDNVQGGTAFTGADAIAAQSVADAMSTAWIQFARTGNPNSPGEAFWPRFDAALQPTMIFNVTSRAVSDPARELRLLLQDPPRR